MMGALLAIAAIGGALAVAMGAYAAHAPAPPDPRALGWIETAVRYQMWHALALVAIVALAARPGGRKSLWLRLAAIGFLAGTLLFCGSLYFMALAGWRAAAVVTPFGGAALVLGWVALAAHGVALCRLRGAPDAPP